LSQDSKDGEDKIEEEEEAESNGGGGGDDLGNDRKPIFSIKWGDLLEPDPLSLLFSFSFSLPFLINTRHRERESESRDSGRERAGQQATKERREESIFIIIILKGTATVFPYVLGNTVETQWRRLNIGLLLWGVFEFFLFFSLNEGKQTPIGSLLQVL
jgi:hypothetical protein